MSGKPTVDPDSTLSSPDVGGIDATRADLGDGVPVHSAPARGQAIGRYLVTGQLGAGAMGFVLAAHDPELDRRVALKLVRPEVLTIGGSGAHARLVREAQAMARLSHPNVVPVFDAGTVDDQVFVAMELVEGSTLREWLRAKPRTWREVRDAFLQAGRGLQAAHAAGIVHRDFKPDNVLVSRDGRVRVTDFGLARTAAPDATAPPSPAQLDNSSPRTSASPVLTQAGAIMGTPAYMAPEAHDGQPTDARTDQFAFCVALYEGLYGERPFRGTTFQEVAQAVRTATPRFSSMGRKVPGHLRKVLARGLARNPADRFPSMDPILDELARDPDLAARRIALGAGVLVLVGAVAVGVNVWDARARRACDRAGNTLAEVWNDARREAARASLVGSGVAYGDAAAAGAVAAVDRYAGRWIDMRVEACQATRVRGEQSEALLDRRIACLTDRLDEVDALANVLAHATPTTTEHAVDAANALTPLARCADASALLAAVELPKDAAAVHAADRAIAGVKALLDAGEYAAALAAAGPARALAEGVAYGPALARAWYWEGKARYEAGEREAGRDALQTATWTAVAAGDGYWEARAAISLMSVEEEAQRFDTARQHSKHAEAAIVRQHDNGDLRIRWLGNLSRLETAEGRVTEALTHAAEVVALTEPAGDSLDLASALTALGVTLQMAGQYQESVAPLERAGALREALLGEAHPLVGQAEQNIGNAYLYVGRASEAIPHHRRAVDLATRAYGPLHAVVAQYEIALSNSLSGAGDSEASLTALLDALRIQRATLPPDHADIGVTLSNVGVTYSVLGRNKEALVALRAALAIQEAKLGQDHPAVALTVYNVAEIERMLGQYDDANRDYERALRSTAAALTEAHPDYLYMLVGLADLRREQGRLAEALSAYDRALAGQEAALGRDHPDLAYALTGKGLALNARKLASEAAPVLERAVALRTAAAGDAGELGQSQLALGAALAATGGERSRVHSLAKAALAGFGENPRWEKERRTGRALAAAFEPSAR